MKNIPLIKYNPGNKYENIYRLYTNGYVSTTGTKIPSIYISSGRKSAISNITKILSLNQSVGFYIEHVFKKKVIKILCEFYENGNIVIKFNCPILLDIKDINLIVRESINNTILVKNR